MIKKLNLIFVILVAGLLLGWAVSVWMPDADQPASLSNGLAAAPTGGDFSLNTADGPFSLQDQRGKVVLLFFGYTFCPDVCPTNLALITQALNALTEEELKHVQGVFVSVDPARDTLDKLAAYTNHFHSAIVGVTGDPDAVARAAKQYGAAYRKVEGESEGGYLVDHSSNTYVIASDGSLHATLPHAAPPQEILAVIRGLLGQIN